VGPQWFRFATVAGDTGVALDETCVRVSFLPVASTSPRRSSSPVRRPIYHLKFLAVAKVEVARPVHLAEFVHLPEASAISLPTEKSSCGPPTTAWPPGAICRDHELVAAAGAHGSQPMRSAELRSCAPVGAMCLSTVTVSLSAGGASARGATVAVSALRSESRPTPRRGPSGRRRHRGGRKRDETNAHREQKYLDIRLTPYRPETMVEAADE
jgi:hypothetical protein